MKDMYFSTGDKESEITIDLWVDSIDELGRNLEELNEIADKCHRLAFKINVQVGGVREYKFSN